MPTSTSELDRRHVWHPFTQAALAEPPIALTHAQGSTLYGEDGRTYIDAIASWWVNLHGHAHPTLIHAIAEQAARLEHVIFAGFSHAPAAQLAARLAAVLPEHLTRIFYSDNGSTAVEVAVKMALQSARQNGMEAPVMIALEGSYHGDTFGAMSVSERDAFTAPFFPYLFETIYIPAPLPGSEAECLEKLEATLAERDVAGLVYEPLVQGASGMRMMQARAVEAMLTMARKGGALLIADEVMTGFGRTGPLFASQAMQTQPDLVALSKGLTGGTMAMGVTATSEAMYRRFWSKDMRQTFFHGHSFTANPMACAAALASLELTVSPDSQADRDRIAQRHAAFKEAILDKHPLVQDARQCGTILAFELLVASDKRTDAPYPESQAGEDQPAYFHAWRDQIYRFFLDRGVLLRPLGNTIYLLPPYCITERELAACYAAIEAVLEAAAAW